jgi:hypothetical protein
MPTAGRVCHVPGRVAEMHGDLAPVLGHDEVQAQAGDPVIDEQLFTAIDGLGPEASGRVTISGVKRNSRYGTWWVTLRPAVRG